MGKKITFYVLKRLGLGLLTYLIVVTITFWVMQLVPGGPWTREKALSDAVIAALNQRYGLDQPLFVQYLRYLLNAIKFPVPDFGVSYYYKGRSVTDIIFTGFRTSLGVGVSVGFYSTRVGYMTVRAVRPIDLSENSREIFSLGKLRTALFKYVAGKISSAMLHGGSDKKK